MPNLFPISLEVEEVAVGRVLRKLTSMAGVARVHLNLQNTKQLAAPDDDEDHEIKEVKDSRPSYHYRDGRSNKRGKVADNVLYRAIAEVLLKTPAHYHLLGAAIERAGFSPTGIHGMIYRMGKLKLIQRTSPGTYRITPKGEKLFNGNASLVHKALPAPGKGHRQTKFVNNHAGVRRVILTAVAMDSPISRVEMGRALVMAGFSTTNMWNACVKMCNEGLMKLKDNAYSLTEEGRKVYDSKPEGNKGNGTLSNEEGLNGNG